METDSKNASTFQETARSRSNTGDITVNNTVLVSYDLTDDTLTVNCHENEQALDANRLEAIKQGHVGMGIDLDISSFLSQRIRKRTSQAYNHGWKKWMRWRVSQELKVDSLAYDPKNILRFLMDHQAYSIQQLKVYRAAIASVFRVLYPYMPPIASNVIIQDFFQAKLKTVIKLSQQAQIEIWNLSILTKYITTNFNDNTSLTIDKLQQKTILLLCISAIWRPRSNIGTLQARDIHFKFDNDANLTGAALLIRAPKEARQKHSALGTLSEKLMCPVFTLFTFMEKTEHLRSELPVEHTVCLAYVNNPNKIRSIQPRTVANIVKQAMQEAGIDAQVYGPHSLCSASSTEAV